MKSNWTIQDSTETYLISRWGTPYFSINNLGNLDCYPLGDNKNKIDLKLLLDDLRRRGIQPPILIRFNDLLNSRIKTISNTFYKSIKEYGYKGNYQAIMPIKVNQQRHVVQELVKHGKSFNLGLEAGSKPELLVAISLLKEKNSLIICNGYKDNEYIQIALDGQQLGLKIILVLDRFLELLPLLKIAKQMKITPNLGIRVKISFKGQGRWKESSGDKSKFGLSPAEIIKTIKYLKKQNMHNCIKLLHFHIGSQITSIIAVKTAAREAAHLYCNLKEMGCLNLNTIDVGGGLAVDYDGSKTNFHSSMNYSTQEYANDVVSIMQNIYDIKSIKHPNILSESGRSLVAHHSVLIFNVLEINQLTNQQNEIIKPPKDDDHNIVHLLWDAYKNVTLKNFQEAYNDAVAAKDESMTLFSHGVINLKTKAHIEELFWLTCKKIQKTIKSLKYIPEDLEGLDQYLSDTYFSNFSVFQSLPDSWAIGHLFPIMPIHRLNEEPDREAVIADLTCDSDGKIDRFIDLRDVKRTIKLHKANGFPYYLGAFLIGAYQEILGDLHNLLGDTNTAHVTLDNNNTYRLEHVIKGDTIAKVLSLVQYNKSELINNIRNLSEYAVRRGTLTLEESAKLMKRYENGLASYTYLKDIN